ncbi:MAG: histidinol-phosphate transaminase [Bacteroidetes bacterium]|nr:histidinol-phosphate transaminase [Bacteroidota bacterium]
MNISELVRKNIKVLKPYSSARDEFEGEASVFLDANENPYPSEYNRYPDPHQKKLKAKIAALKSVKTDQVFIGNGSDEAIDLLFRAFCEPGSDEVIIPQPTYGMYSVSANINDVAIRSVNLTNDFDLDVDSILKLVTNKTKLLFLCTPNNPSGNLLSPEKVIQLIKVFPGLVIVDEAYIDFSSQPGFVPLLSQYNNLVVLQTLSKAWGLAGLRVGLAFASPEIIAILDKIKPPYNINTLSQSVALNALNEVNQKNAQVSEILAQRKILTTQLNNLPQVEHIYPSEANFVLVRIKNARQVYQTLIQKGVVVRDRSNVILCQDCLRITVGTPEENQHLITELQTL